MIKQYTKRYEQWKRNVGTTSLFVIVCGVVAFAYFGYRIVLVATPLAAIEHSVAKSPTSASVVCQEDEGNTQTDPLHLLSTQYETRIRQQPALTPNIITNPDFSHINASSNEPVGYFHSIDDNGASYQYLQQVSDGVKFLRTVNTQPRLTGKVLPAWLMQPVAIAPSTQTYAYSFWYRATTPIHVSTESVIGGHTYYADITTLNQTTSWQQFTAHFDNINQATQFRVDITGTGMGQVDIRGLDVHQIPAAESTQGIVSVAFDDGWQSIYDKALPLLKAYNIRTTQYIISDVARQNVPGYMNDATIARLKQSGQEIGSHTLTHCDQTKLSPSVLQANVDGSKQQLEAQALGPIKSFAYPMGRYNSTTQAAYETQYPLIRTSDFGYNDRYFDETSIHSISVLNTTTDQAFQSWLSYAEQHHVWVVLVYHRVDESGAYNVTSDQLNRQLKMIATSGLKTLPLSKAATAARD